METILLIFVSIAALVMGVLSAYGACLMLFALVRLNGGQQAIQTTQAPAIATEQPASA